VGVCVNRIGKICSGNQRDYEYLIALVAQMFQEPHLKPGIAVVLRGDEGVGKSFFIEKLSALMDKYHFKTSNPAYVFGDHNGQLKNVILLHLEEAVWAGSKKDESLLKDLITGPEIPI
jgi:predicted P-loop ATPase